jgi:Ca2+/H+ antiporter
MIMHIALYTSCIVFMLVSHTYIFAIDPAELELEELQEPAPAEETNPEQEQGKPQCI